MKGPTDRDMEVLNDLIAGYDQAINVDDRYRSNGIAPLDCGGTDCSDHSYRLTRLVKFGLAEHRKRGCPWGEAPTRRRGSKTYRPTEAGRLALSLLRDRS